MRLGFWPVQHGPVDREALTDTDVTRGPVYLTDPADLAALTLDCGNRDVFGRGGRMEN